MTAPAVTVYVRAIDAAEKCYQCDATKRRLTAKGIAFDEVDVDEPHVREALTYLGYTGIPVVVAATAAGEQHWVGYRPDRIDALVVAA
ncbi:NrdH-redoxin [Mycobacterium paragordonae]|uniref:glutaredoxin domain-containing protein n=1 Tax=Mycobacterium paragordonae TaxID=1389713 RepID=UPI0010611AE8|nr:glutaredoxin domain-containing protein [Mycobacterium paragordonae]TDK87550.1 NrdH-redoxin [Mycobacterium paragordonae]TDL01119.1 NrdH-redoxin [Mycobacterium paragordonae]